MWVLLTPTLELFRRLTNNRIHSIHRWEHGVRRDRVFFDQELFARPPQRLRGEFSSGSSLVENEVQSNRREASP
jgi:hypothetical protein